MRIKTNDPIIRRCFELQATAISEHGGYIHPELLIHHKGNALSIECCSNKTPSTLLIIPHNLFIPVSDLEWWNDDGNLRFNGNISLLSAVQKSLLDSMVSIYNQTNKLHTSALQLPAFLLAKDHDLCNWLLQARPSYTPPNKNLAELFILTRTSSLEETQGSNQFTRYLMPLIDNLNHHPHGSKFERTPEAGWRIALKNPIEDSNECFLRYRKSDSLMLALWHGYAESNTNHLVSLDCVLKHSEIGVVKIISSYSGHLGVNAPCIVHGEPNLTLCDLVLQKDKHQALLTLIGLAIRSKRRDIEQSEAESIANDLVLQIIESNNKKYTELLELCRVNAEQFPLRTLFGQVASHQLSLLARTNT